MAVYPRTGDTEVPAQPSFPALEREVLEYWEGADTFRTSIRQRPADREFVFYDGPPFANGLPHYGHLITGYVKDVVPRFRTMQGYRVERRFGWDCHGLPAEVEAERLLGISGKADILAMGIEKFNHACRESVLRYTREWRNYVTRQARWVDFDNDYKTLDLPYMESVMWAFRQLWDKGLVYQGFKVLPYCWRCETPLSNHELRMDDDTYAERQDPSVTVRFKLETGEWLLAWTTTPWTLPSNLACAVGADISYVVVAKDGERYILARDRQAAYQRELEGATEVGTLTGAELAGRRYEPLFGYLADADKFGTQDAFRVILSTTSPPRTAPAWCTWPRLRRGRRPGLQRGRHPDRAHGGRRRPVHLRGARLRGPARVRRQRRPRGPAARAGQPGAEGNLHALLPALLAVPQPADLQGGVELVRRGEHVPGPDGRAERADHLGARARQERPVRQVAGRRAGLVDQPEPVLGLAHPGLAERQPRLPAHRRVRLAGGARARLRRAPGRPAPSGDRQPGPPNPDDPTGQSMMRRVPEVLDCWFESGSMPFAQVHYPFENREWFDSHYPGDFIVEYIGQTRGWFYTLHVLATALFDRPAFRSCVSHGIVLGNDGQKMSKSLRNYPDVNEVFDSFGSDAMRWFLMASPVLRGGNLIVTEQGIRDAIPRQAILPLWNCYYFFALYANAESYAAKRSLASEHVLDRYILAKTRAAVTEIARALDRYNVGGACQALREHLEVLTNWYIRRSRNRFWAGERDALDTLWTVLETVCRAAAPLLPLTTETVWRGLTGEPSVHLASWPDVSPSAGWALLNTDDGELTGAIERDLARAACSTALGLRKAHQLRVRLPLASLVIAHPDAESLAPFTELIADEVNVKAVELSADPASLGRFELVVNPRLLGPRLGGQVQQVIRVVKAGAWTRVGERVVAAGVELEPGEYELKLAVDDPESTSALPGNTGLIALDLAVTPELAAEGTARDVVRVVQQARRDACWVVPPTGSGRRSAPTARSPTRFARTPGSWRPRRSPWTWRYARPASSAPIATRWPMSAVTLALTRVSLSGPSCAPARRDPRPG